MAFPSIAGTATTNGTTATATPAVNLPASIAAGETLIVLIRVAVAGAIGWPAGWTELFDVDTDASDDQMACAWRKADGTEGSTITCSSGNGKFAALAWRISAAADPTIRAPQVQSIITGLDANPTNTSLVPTGGVKDYLFLWIGGWEGEQTSPPAGNPEGYTLSPIGASSGTAGVVTTNCRVAGAGKQVTDVNSGIPNVDWPISVADDWTVTTLAVHPVPPPPNAWLPLRRRR